MRIVRCSSNPCTRYFAGNRGYVKVYYNRSDNKLEISSQTGMNIRHIAELQIKVTCTHKWQSRGVRERGTNRVISPAKWNEEQVTICDSRYTNIPVNIGNSTFCLSQLSNGICAGTTADFYGHHLGCFPCYCFSDVYH